MSVVRIGITGHRALQDPGRVEREIEATLRSILEEKNATSFMAFSGMAYGADTGFARVSIQKFGAELFAILPFPVKEFEKDFDKPEYLTEFRTILGPLDAMHTRIISDNGEGDARVRAYGDVGKYIVDNCDVLIAVWDGKPPKGRGGTADIIDYCIEKNKELHFISAEKKLLMYEDPGMYNLYKEIARKYKVYDQVANEAQTIFNSYWHLSVYLSIFSVLCLAIPVVISFSPLLAFLFAGVEVISILSLLMVIRIIQNKRMHGRRIYTRMAAERLRILKMFCICGLPVDRRIFEINFGKEEETIQSEIAEQELILNNLLNERAYINGTAQPNLEYLLKDQLTYHQNRLSRNEGKLKIYNTYKNWIKWIFLGGLFYHLVVSGLELAHVQGVDLPHWPGILLTLFLPPVYAAIEGFIYFNEWERTEKHSKQMKDFFERKLAELKTESPDIDRFAASIREEMLKENENWELLLLDKKKPNEL